MKVSWQRIRFSRETNRRIVTRGQPEKASRSRGFQAASMASQSQKQATKANKKKKKTVFFFLSHFLGLNKIVIIKIKIYISFIILVISLAPMIIIDFIQLNLIPQIYFSFLFYLLVH